MPESQEVSPFPESGQKALKKKILDSIADTHKHK